MEISDFKTIIAFSSSRLRQIHVIRMIQHWQNLNGWPNSELHDLEKVRRTASDPIEDVWGWRIWRLFSKEEIEWEAEIDWELSRISQPRKTKNLRFVSPPRPSSSY